MNVINQAPNNMIPTIVRLNIYYQQFSQTTKKIIDATVSFENSTSPTNAQYAGTDVFEYTVYFSLIPLTHTDLINMFAMDWPVYLVVYIAIGFVALGIIGIFTLYHTLMEMF